MMTKRWCVAVCCSALQYVVVCCSVLHRVFVKHTATVLCLLAHFSGNCRV